MAVKGNEADRVMAELMASSQRMMETYGATTDYDAYLYSNEQ